MAQRITRAILENRLESLQRATEDASLHISGAYGGWKVESNISRDYRGQTDYGTGSYDFLETGYVSRRELYAAMNAAIRATWHFRYPRNARGF